MTTKNLEYQNPPTSTSHPRDVVDITVQSEVSRVTLDGNYPATDLIAVLLQYIGTTANAFVRDVHTAGQVFHRSLAVYDGIRELMAKVDKSPVLDWANFDAYTLAIPPLEQRVLPNRIPSQFPTLIYACSVDFFSNFMRRTLTIQLEISFHHRMTS